MADFRHACVRKPGLQAITDIGVLQVEHSGGLA